MTSPLSIEVMRGHMEGFDADGSEVSFSLGKTFISLRAASTSRRSLRERSWIEVATRRTFFDSNISVGLAFRSEPRGLVFAASRTSLMFMPALAVIVLVVIAFTGFPDSPRGIWSMAGLMAIAAYHAFRLIEIRRAVATLEAQT